MKPRKKIKTIPTLIGLTIVSAGLVVGLFLIERSQNIFSRATTENNPRQVKISNITSNSLTISWLTTGAASGRVKFGTDAKSFDSEANDERDADLSQRETYFSHYVSLTNLEPSTTYYYQIYSDSRRYDDNGRPYQITTAPEIIGNPPANDLAYGTILDSGGQPAEGALVYLNLANSTLQTSLVSSSGNWAVPLNQARTTNLSDYISYDLEASTIEIFVQFREKTANAVTTTNNDSPVPPITIGESFDFREKASAEEAEMTFLSGFILEEDSLATPSYSLTITNPQEGESLATQKPLFMGKGPAEGKITIEIESSQELAGEVTTSIWGNWSWTPPKNLEPGEHTITISYFDDQGIKQSISRAFIILAAEDSQLPSFTATPSAAPTIEPSPTPTSVLPTPEETPTATPALGLTPTPTSSPAPTMTPTLALSPTPTATVPPEEVTAGLFLPTFLVFITGIIILGGGLLLAP
jgi:hypothetical protein